MRGPLVLRDASNGDTEIEGKPVLNLYKGSEKSKDIMEVVQTNLTGSQTKQKTWYYKHAWKCSFEVGDSVLIPMKKYKMQNSWDCPFGVIEEMTVYISC